MFSAQDSNYLKTKLLLWCATGLLVALTGAPAATHYVDAASTNAVPPFTNWANAAANIQDAVDAAAPGDEIVVTNGVYQTGARAVYGMSNRVAVTKPVTVRSVNGPELTRIIGSGSVGPNAVRCVYLMNSAVLTGFTLTNGATQDSGDGARNLSGGGVWCESASAVVSNCTLTGNSARNYGGGAIAGTLNACTLTNNHAVFGGGAYNSTLINCTLVRNSAEYGGGATASTLNNCMVTGNSTSNDGGGAEASTLNNCTLTGNSAGEFGGGASRSTLMSCTLSTNVARVGGGAAYSVLNSCTLMANWGETGGGVFGGTLNNCTLAGNSAYSGGGATGGRLSNCTLKGNWTDGPSGGFSYGGGAYDSWLNGCMVTGNASYAFGRGGGVYFSRLTNCTLTGNSSVESGGAMDSKLNNCIVYYNSSVFGNGNHFGSAFTNSCTTPVPGSGVGNITSAPLFVDTNGWSNLRLQSNSPCINAGNNAYVTAATDLDGLPRIAGGTVDIGAYEFQSPASTISYAWLQQSGLPTDGSADAADTDHDGHNNWQEWMAGTEPTNALSALRLASPVITPTNVILTWTSVANRTYTVEQATNLGGAPAFSVLRSNLAGLPGTTSWTDTNAPVSSPRFYQLRVSP